MTTRQLTQVYLEPEQKKALQVRAKSHGTKVSEEIRRAVNAYLGGITSDELMILDAASRSAEKELQCMVTTLEATNKKLDAVFEEMERLRSDKDQAA